MLSMVAGFIMPLLLVRFMSQNDYGVFSQYFTLYSAIYVIVALGTHTNIFFFCPSATKEESDRYVSNTLILNVLFGVVAGMVMFVPQIQHLLFGESELGKSADFIALSIALAVPMNIISPLNTTRQDKWGALLFPGGVAFARIATVVFAMLVYKDLHELFFWLVIYQLVIFAVVCVYVLADIKFAIDYQLMKKQLAYSIPFGIAVALQLFSNYFDKFVCIRFINPADYAVYSVAFLSIPGITQVYDSLCQVNIVNMANSYKLGLIEEILVQYRTFVVKTLSFSVPIILAVFVFSDEIISFLYTAQYQNASPYFRVYSLTFIISMFGAGTILRSMCNTKLSMIAFGLSCFFGLPTTYFLVKYYGTDGAIVGAVMNIILPRLIQMSMEMRQLNVSLTSFLPWRKLFLIMSIAVLLLTPICIVKLLFSLNIIHCVIISFVYVGFAYSLYICKNLFIINKSELTKVMSNLWKRRK